MADPTIDLSLISPAAPDRPTLAGETAASELAAFVKTVQATLTAYNPAAVPAGQVLVFPGNKVFSTISDALASITDASEQKPYACYIGAGTFNETVLCKSWVFLQGQGFGQSGVTAPAVGEFATKGTLQAVSNSAVYDLAITSVGNGGGTFATALACNAAVLVDIENCLITSIDSIGGANNLAVAIDYQENVSGSIVNFVNAQIAAQVNAGDAQPVGLLAFSGSYVQIYQSPLEGVGGKSAWGAASNGGSQLILDKCLVFGTQYALNITQLGAVCIATDCEIHGPVQSGVVVNAR